MGSGGVLWRGGVDDEEVRKEVGLEGKGGEMMRQRGVEDAARAHGSLTKLTN